MVSCFNSCISLLINIINVIKCYKKSLLYKNIIQIKPPNDAEFVRRAAGRGPKSFLWSYHDEKC